MKKFLLSALTLVFAFTLVQLTAQTRVAKVAVVEQFTQASCPPCAVQNPAFNARLQSYPGQLVAIKYQTSFPGFDPMHLHNPNEVNERQAYYNVNAVPNVVVEGINYGVTNNASTAVLNGATDDSTTVEMIMTQTYNSNYTGFEVNLEIKNLDVNPLNTAGHVLHVVMIEEEISFATPPGSTNERDFLQVMRDMYFGSEGLTLDVVIPAGESEMFNWEIEMPSYVYNPSEVAFVAWVQNVSTRESVQATRTMEEEVPVALPDIATTGAFATPPAVAECVYDVTGLAIQVQNPGAETITAFTAELVDLDGNVLSSADFDGELLSGESTTVTLDDATVPSGQFAGAIRVNANTVNGTRDGNGFNHFQYNVNFVTLDDAIYYTDSIFQDMETISFDLTPEGSVVDEPAFPVVRYVQASNFGGSYPFAGAGGYAQSNASLMGFMLNNGWPTGATGDFYLQKADLTNMKDGILTFDYCGIPSIGTKDTVHFQASSDCGATWTSIRKYSMDELATRAEVAPGAALATWWATEQDWATDTLDVSAFDNMDEVIFRIEYTKAATGGVIYIDNFDVNSNVVVSVNDIETLDAFSVYPNPTAEVALVDYTLTESTNLTVEITDIMGRRVAQLMNNEIMPAGQHQLRWNASSAQNGVYIVRMRSDKGEISKRVVVSH